MTLGAAVVVASATLVASLDRMVDEPARYGARWDAIAVDDITMQPVVDAVSRSPDIIEAGGMFRSDGLIEGPPTPIVAIAALKGASAASWTTIVDGRAPERDSEVAVGATTMRELHTGIGGHVSLQVNNISGVTDLVVVGQTVFNNSSDLEAGVGALITESLARAHHPRALPDEVVV